MTQEEIELLITKSVEMKDSETASTLNQLGWNYQNAVNGESKDENLAIKCYEASAKGGNAFGMTNYAYCLLNGVGTEINKDEAFKWFKSAADLGNAYGYGNLAWCYENGISCDKDLKKSATLYVKAILIDKNLKWVEDGFRRIEGDPDENGIGLDGIRWVAKFWHYSGGFSQTPENPTLKFKWTKIAAEQLNDGEWLYNTAELYFRGYGVEEDICKSFSILMQAIDKGHKPAIEWFNTEYGFFKEKKLLQDKKDFMKRTLLKLDDNCNFHDCGNILSYFTDNTTTDELTIEEKNKIETIINNNGSTDFLNWHHFYEQFALCYKLTDNPNMVIKMLDRILDLQTKGEYIADTSKYDKMRLWAERRILEKGAQNGDAEAAFKIATMYENGDGVEQNFEMAQQWYVKANANGHPNAISMLLLLNNKMLQRQMQQMQNAANQQIADANARADAAQRESDRKIAQMQADANAKAEAAQRESQNMMNKLQAESREAIAEANARAAKEAKKAEKEMERQRLVSEQNADPSVNVTIRYTYYNDFYHQNRSGKFYARMHRSEYLALLGDNASLCSYAHAQDHIDPDDTVLTASISIDEE